MSKVSQQVTDFLVVAATRKVTVSCRGNVVTADKRFAEGDKDAYVWAEDDCNAVLSKAPQTESGSTWGTDSGSVGGAIGLQNGYCRLHKSGIGKRFCKELQERIQKLNLEMTR